MKPECFFICGSSCSGQQIRSKILLFEDNFILKTRKTHNVPNKFGFSGFPDKKHSVWNLPVHELSYLSNADLAMVSQLEGFESAPKAPEKLYFHVLLGVFYYQIRDFRKLYSKSGLYWIPRARTRPQTAHVTRTRQSIVTALRGNQREDTIRRFFWEFVWCSGMLFERFWRCLNRSDLKV